MPAAAIQFDPAAHLYTVAGVEKPSVTRILKDLRLTPPYPDDQGWLAFGRAVHRCCELYLLGRLKVQDGPGGLEFPGTSDSLWPHLRGFVQKCAELRIRPINVELMVHHPLAGYCGTLDIHCGLHDAAEEWIIDLKTGVPPGATALQTAGYDLALSQQLKCPARRRRRAAMRLTPDRAIFTEYSNPHDYTAWLGAVAVWKWRQAA